MALEKYGRSQEMKIPLHAHDSSTARTEDGVDVCAAALDNLGCSGGAVVSPLSDVSEASLIMGFVGREMGTVLS